MAFDLRAKGLLYHGSTAGLLPVTIASLNTLVLGGDAPIARLAVVLFALFPLSVTVALKAWRRPLGIVSGTLLLDVLLRMALARLLDVNYPEDRAALHLLWLALIAVLLALDEVSSLQSSRRRRSARSWPPATSAPSGLGAGVRGACLLYTSPSPRD